MRGPSILQSDDLRSLRGVAVLNSLRGGSEVSQEDVALETSRSGSIGNVEKPLSVFDLRLSTNEDRRFDITHNSTPTQRPTDGAVADSAGVSGDHFGVRFKPFTQKESLTEIASATIPRLGATGRSTSPRTPAFSAPRLP